MLVGWSDLWLVFVQEFYSLKLQAPVGQQYSRKEWGRESIIDGKTEWQAESIARTSEALGQVCQHTWACGKIWGGKRQAIVGICHGKGEGSPRCSHARQDNRPGTTQSVPGRGSNHSQEFILFSNLLNCSNSFHRCCQGVSAKGLPTPVLGIVQHLACSIHCL